MNLVDEYLEKHDWRVRENSNASFSLQGLNHYVVGDTVAKWWLDNVYTKEIADAHRKGVFHVHDLSCASAYCVGWDLYDLLLRGYGGVNGKVNSRPAKHFSAALGQLVNFFYTMGGEVAGAVAVSSFDTLLAPFIRYDNLNYEQVKQAIQEFVYSMNAPTRLGFQCIFSNVTFDLIPSPNYAGQNVVVGGEFQEETYAEFEVEMRMINQAFCEVMLEGDAHGRVFSFPIPTYNLFEGFDWDNQDYLWEMTAKYGIPYFANFMNSELRPEDVTSLCCRLRLDRTQLQKRAGGLFAASSLTGSVGVVTINVARIGYETKSVFSEDEIKNYRGIAKREFLLRLFEVMNLAKDSLEIKRALVEELTQRGLYPYSAHYLDSVHQRYGKYWANHFSTIGLNGMHEACLNLLGVGIDTKEGREFALETLEFMLDKLREFQNETGNLYNLEASPCESATFRMAKADKKEYPNIITAGTNETPFYTNSTHLPVDTFYDIGSVLDHQEELQKKYTGGCVNHVFLGEAIDDWRNARAFIRTVAENWQVPYFTLTPTFSVCKNHGYLKGKVYVCPTCKEETEVYSRVVGYLRPTKNWNDAKQLEFKQRTTFEV